MKKTPRRTDPAGIALPSSELQAVYLDGGAHGAAHVERLDVGALGGGGLRLITASIRVVMFSTSLSLSKEILPMGQ